MRLTISTFLLLLPLSALAQPKSAPPAASGPTPPALCEAAIAAAETGQRLPARMLGAIAVTESGRFDASSGYVRPWPWTINAEGVGQFFASKADAIGAVRALQARGVHSIDVGCMQVNLYFHPDAFASLDAAFDPRTNAAYAVRFLKSLYAASGDWAQAIGSYHSDTPALGSAYRALVLARWQGHAAYIQTPPVAHAAYAAFAPRREAYAAFAPRGQVYGAFGGQDTGALAALGR